MWFLPPKRSTWAAAARDIHAKDHRFRIAAAERLADQDFLTSTELASVEKGQSALEGLKILTTDTNYLVRRAALRGLTGVLQPAFERGHPTPGWLSKDWLENAMRDPDPGCRKQCAILAAVWGPQGGTQLLKDWIKNDTSKNRSLALQTLADWELPYTLEELRPLLCDADPQIQADAIYAIGALPPSSEVVEALNPLIDNPTLEVLAQAALALALHHPERAEPVLIRLLSSKQYAYSAVLALGDIHSENAKQALLNHSSRWFLPSTMKLALAHSLDKHGHPRTDTILKRLRRRKQHTVSAGTK